MLMISKMQLTVLHLASFPFKMFKACITITPEIIAFVVAMAGIIFPAMAKGTKREREESIRLCLTHRHFVNRGKPSQGQNPNMRRPHISVESSV